MDGGDMERGVSHCNLKRALWFFALYCGCAAVALLAFRLYLFGLEGWLAAEGLAESSLVLVGLSFLCAANHLRVGVFGKWVVSAGWVTGAACYLWLA